MAALFGAMQAWAKQIAGTILVVAFALGIGGFILLLRFQQAGLASSMAAANVTAVNPSDGATNVATSGVISASYQHRPRQDPTIKVEPPAGIALTDGHWDGTTFVIEYAGLRPNSLYHVELDQDDSSQKGEHRQVKVRWSFQTGSSGLPPTASATPSARSSATPSPTASTSALPSLIWYAGSSPGAAPLTALDWNGKVVKTLKGVGRLQSPDGQKIYNSMTPSTDVFDANGNLVGSIAPLSPNLWADDDNQFCGIGYMSSNGSQNLVTMSFDGNVRSVAPLSLPDSTGKPAAEVGLVACSQLAKRAIVIGASNGYIWSLALISLTDGSIIYQTRYPNPLTRVVASHDGEYVAEQLAGNASGGPFTMIRQLPAGQVVGQVRGIAVAGFSWDGSLVAGGTGANPSLGGVEVLRWQTNQVVFDRCGCPAPYSVRMLAEPQGTRLAVVATNQQGTGSLIIVDASGNARTAASGSLTALF